MVDKPLGAGLKLFIVNISLENGLHTCHYKENKNIQYIHIDLANGYWQIKVADKDREKTAFGSHLGLYEFLCLPFGLTGAPAMFSRLMDKVLDGLIGKNCPVYLDDVIIFGSSFEETLTNLKLVMGHLRDHNLLCKARKCELLEMSIAFLGHVVSEEGITTDPAKEEKIKTYPHRKTSRA